MHEDKTGRVLDFEGKVYRADGTTVDLASVGTSSPTTRARRRLSGGVFTLVHHDGSEEDYPFEVACEPSHPQGFGYTRGWNDGGQPGVYRGVEVIETDSWDVSDPAGRVGPDHTPVDKRLGGTEFATRCTGPERFGRLGARRAHDLSAVRAVRLHGLIIGGSHDQGSTRRPHRDRRL